MRGALSFLLLLVLAVVALAACKAKPEPPIVAGATYTACVSCHLDDYEGAGRHPNVKPTTCGVCHTKESWHPQWLVHPWALTGAHVGVDCFKCHVGTPTVFTHTTKQCVGCHRAEYDRTPGHAERFPVTCEECHSTYVWKPAYWVDDWVPDAGTTASDAGEADAGAPEDAATAVDAYVAKPAGTWRAPPKPTTTVPPKPTATVPPKPDVTSHPSPRR